MTKRFVLFLLVVVLTGAFPAVGGLVSGAHVAEDVSFFLDCVPYGKYASFYAGVKHGIFQKYGLNVKIQPGKGSGLAVKTVASKGADYGHVDLGTLIIARANNPDVRVKEIAMLHHDNQFVVASLEAFKWPVENPKEAIGAFIAKNPSVSREIARGHWENRHDGQVSQAATQAQARGDLHQPVRGCIPRAEQATHTMPEARVAGPAVI